jgi:hypothetical protein
LKLPADRVAVERNREIHLGRDDHPAERPFGSGTLCGGRGGGDRSQKLEVRS